VLLGSLTAGSAPRIKATGDNCAAAELADHDKRVSDLDDLLDGGSRMAGENKETVRVRANLLVLLERHRYLLIAFVIHALADEGRQRRRRGKIFDPLIDLAKKALIPCGTLPLQLEVGLFHHINFPRENRAQ
jgi:hypothetical protein